MPSDTEKLEQVRKLLFDAGCQEWCEGIGDSGENMPKCSICQIREVVYAE